MQGAVSYHQHYRRCGKSNCSRCGQGPGHGPYWYASWREGAHVRTRYIGKELPPGIDTLPESRQPAATILQDAPSDETETRQPGPVQAAEMTRAAAGPATRATGASAIVPSPVSPSSGQANGRATHATGLRIRVLGHFRVERGGVPITDWQRLTATALLKRLLLADHRRLPREQLMDELWPEADLDAAREALATAVHALRRALEPGLAAGGRSRYLVQQGESLALVLGTDDWVDLFVFESLLAQVGAASDPGPLLDAAAAIYGGDLLPDEPAEWCAAPREALRLRWHGSLLTLAETQAARRQYDAAATTLGRLLSADPAQEEAARRLMGLLARQGRRTDALRVYRRLERALREDLDAPPAPETTAVVAALQIGAAPPRLPTGTSGARLESAVLPLVGRAPELDRLRAALRAARDGHGRAVLLSGEAGIGKTRLAEETALLATALGFATLRGRAAEGEQELPYAPVAEALRGHTRSCPHGALRRDLKGAEALVSILPELATIIQSPASPPLADPGAARLRLWTAVRTLLAAAAESTPVLVTLEDLHWADQATLSLLAFLVRRCGDLRLLLLGTMRDEEVEHSHPLRRLALEGRRDGSLDLLALSALSLTEVEDLARGRLGTALSAAEVAALHTHGAGNPFFIGELLTLIRERRHTGTDGAAIAAVLGDTTLLPQTIRQTLAHRLDRLSPTCRALLQAGAVLGERFPAAVLARVAGQQTDAFEDALDEAVAAGLLHPEAELEGDGYALLHALLRRALYEELLPRQRRRLHIGAAAALIEMVPAGSEPSIELIAYHYAHTAEHDQAAQWLERAGDRATGIHANQVALAHYGLARDHLLAYSAGARAEANAHPLARLDEKLGDLRLLEGDFATAQEDFARARTLAADAAWRAELRRKEGVSWERRGDYDRALAAFAEAEGAGDSAERTLPADVLAAIEVSRGQVHWRRGDYEAAGAAAERAQALLRDEPEGPASAQVYNLLGNVARTRSDFVRAEEHHRRGLAIRERLGDQHGLAGSWNNLGMVAHFRGDYPRAEECYRHGLAIYERIGDQHGIANCWNSLGLLAHYRGGYPQAEEYHLRSLAIRERIGDQHGIAGSWNNLGLAALYQSHYRRAEECYHRSLAAQERMGDQQNIASCLNNLGLVAMGRGDLAGAEAYYGRSLAIDERLLNQASTAGTLSNLGDVACERGDFAAAIGLYRRARHLARRIGEPEVQAYAVLGLARACLRSRSLRYAAPPLRCVRALLARHTLGQVAVHVELLTAELYLRRGEASQARPAAREALRLAREGSLLQEQALAQRVLGQCACARGTLGEAERLLRVSIRSLEEIEATLELARSRLALAEVQAARARAAGHRPDSRAGELLLQAREAFTACGALWDLAQADGLVVT